MPSFDWRDIAQRVTRTFLQSFLAQVAVQDFLNLDVPRLTAAATAGLAAVIALVYNLAVQYSNEG